MKFTSKNQLQNVDSVFHDVEHVADIVTDIVIFYNIIIAFIDRNVSLTKPSGSSYTLWFGAASIAALKENTS